MFGFPDSDKCPIDTSGTISPNKVPGKWYDHALTPDEVSAEYKGEQRIRVNKTTHRIKFENETESCVDVVISEKETAELK